MNPCSLSLLVLVLGVVKNGGIGMSFRDMDAFFQNSLLFAEQNHEY